MERAFEASDSILGNLLFFAGWCAICMVIWRLISQKDKEQQNKLLHRIVIVLCCILAVILICWLRISHYEPEADQYHVYSSAVEMLMGDYACMDFANYMDFYPFQLDLAFLFQMAFKLFGSTDISVIQNINVAGIVLTIYLGYWVLREITDELPAQICYIMFSYSMVPLFLYVGYVYGDVISLCAANIAILSVIRWCRTHKNRYAVLLILSMMVGCMARRTIYITLIAIVIGLLYHVIKERCWKSLIIVFLCIMMSVGISKAVTGYYEKQSGFPGGQGLPISYRLNTGVQESILGAGQYNWNLLLEYYDVNLDYVMFDEHSKQLLKSRIKEFISSPPMLFDFYRRKLMEQWNDHTFSSAYAMSRVEEWDKLNTLFFTEISVDLQRSI